MREITTSSPPRLAHSCDRLSASTPEGLRAEPCQPPLRQAAIAEKHGFDQALQQLVYVGKVRPLRVAHEKQFREGQRTTLTSIESRRRGQSP